MSIYSKIKVFHVVIILSLFGSLFFCNSNKIYASTIFEEDFDSYSDNEFPDKWSVLNSTGDNSCNSLWKVNNKILKISINNKSCTTNITPKELPSNGDSINNYIYELDAYFIQGQDHNIVFRYDKSTPTLFWELHFVYPYDFGTSVPTPGSTIITNIQQTYPNRTNPYHIKVEVNNRHLKVYVDNLLVREYIVPIDIPLGRVILRAGTGANRYSETWFDNIKVTSIDDGLNVQYYSQNDKQWGMDEYDHSKSLGFSNSNFERWGCAVTSAAMVLNYHKINHFNDGTSIDPGSLNKWLNLNNGYITGYNKNHESYSYLNWNVISTLSQRLFIDNKSPTKLEMDIRNIGPNTTTQVDNVNLTGKQLLDLDLTTNKIPDILSVINSQTSSHYVVTKGKTADSYSINDPEWEYPTLSSFGNTYSKMVRYIPSESDLSYIVLVVNPEVELIVQDANNLETGKYIKDETLSDKDQIPNSQYIYENPINNTEENSGTKSHVFYLQKPSSGKYLVTISSFLSEFYTLNILAFNKEGEMNILKPKGVVGPNKYRIYEINFNKDGQSIFNEPINFNSIFDDINSLRDINFINKEPHKDHLVKILMQAYTYLADKNYKMVEQRLRQFDIMLSEHRGETLTEDAYQILHEDINKLRNKLLSV